MKKHILILLALTSFIACDETIFVEDISEETVTIIAPAHEVSLDTGVINFNWETVNEATDYQLQIATPSFDAATQIVVDTLMTTNSLSYELVPNEYQWRVKALNSSFETIYTTSSLTVN
ncbi:hypothetical protein [Urechidicola croceus]|uniref:Fibronectin type-III domain-containing protein n=1 Tax=Urechidicola croceus TaxID=1850246 RepID=A0A1D8P884_9FLAO|nr:hypothetical protein [Urechidicola croceus]AOW20779.1 hypothetical protein LPB138_08855 [Urechidicola croceus]